VELVFRWIKIGLAFSRLVDQKGIGENSGLPVLGEICPRRVVMEVFFLDVWKNGVLGRNMRGAGLQMY
jgi:hypothetical protein